MGGDQQDTSVADRSWAEEFRLKLDKGDRPPLGGWGASAPREAVAHLRSPRQCGKELGTDPRSPAFLWLLCPPEQPISTAVFSMSDGVFPLGLSSGSLLSMKVSEALTIRMAWGDWRD